MNRIILTMIVLIIISPIKGQESKLSERISERNANFFNLNKEISSSYNGYTLIQKANDWEIKRYNRWLWFWVSRLDSTGNLNSSSRHMYDYLKKEIPNTNFAKLRKSISSSTGDWECLGPSHSKGSVKVFTDNLHPNLLEIAMESLIPGAKPSFKELFGEIE